jgi:hypothetical protein
MSSAWQIAASNQSTSSAKNTATSRLPLVTIDLRTLAMRHPAWKLADALEANRLASLDFATLRVANIALPQLSVPNFEVHFEDDATIHQTHSVSADPCNANVHNMLETPKATEVAARGLEALATQAADRQSNEMENFLLAVGARQSDARRQYAQIRRVVLENTVEAVRGAPLPDLMPPLLSDVEQLTVTNLRLKLLGNVFSTEKERASAQAQLDKILADWQSRLRAQEKARAAELQRHLVEEPQQARARGEADLRRDLDRLRREQRALIQWIWQQHEMRVRRDFGDEAARFSLVLPPVPPLALDTGTASTPPHASDIPNFIETKLPPLSSLAKIAESDPNSEAMDPSNGLHLELRPTQRMTIAHRLRRQAWREARKEAQWAARHFRWRWQPVASKRTPAPDRTAAVLQWLAD